MTAYDNHPWWGGICALYYAGADGGLKGVGNAAVIAAGGQTAFLLTAGHVATDLNRAAADDSPFQDLVTARGANPVFRSRVSEVIGTRIREDRDDAIAVEGFTFPTNGDFDLAVGRACVRADGQPMNEYFAMKLLPPPVGTSVVVVGSHGHTLVRADKIGGRSRSVLRSRPVVIETEVTSLRKEHGSLAPGPTFELATNFPPGLSGAPVIWRHDERAFVCGVVSSDSAVDGRATAAALWPLVALTVNVQLADETAPARRPVFQLLRPGIFSVYEPDLAALQVIPKDDGTWTVLRRAES